MYINRIFNENYGFNSPSISRSVSGMEFDQYLHLSTDVEVRATEQSKIDLTKNICLHICSVIEKYTSSTITVYTYNNSTNCIGIIGNGVVSDLKDKISRIQDGGGTDFNRMIEFEKNEQKKSDKTRKQVRLVISDGHDTSGRRSKILEDESNNGIFDIAIGIGNDDTVDSEFLKFLSGNKKDSYFQSTNLEEIEQKFIGNIFQELSSLNMYDATIEIILKNDEINCLIGEEYSEEMNEMELVKYLDSIDRSDDGLRKINDIIECTEVCKNHFTLCTKKSDVDITVPNPDTIIDISLTIDISGSMGDNISYDSSSTIVEEKGVIVESHNKPYVKFEINFSKITPNTAVILRGDIVHASIKYLRNNIKYFEEIKADSDHEHSSNSNIIIERYINLVSEFKEINEIPRVKENFTLIKQKTKSLHDDNIKFMTEIDDKVDETNHVEVQLVQQCKAIWGQIVSRYKATLSKGEQWINFANVNPSSLCERISATISCEISAAPTISRQISDTSGKCKICYNNPVNMIFTDCRHAVTCTDCVETFIDINNITNYSCPICRTHTSSFIKLDEEHQPSCSECNFGIVSYYGECKHPISCKKCAKTKSDKNILYCKICCKDVKVIKVFI